MSPCFQLSFSLAPGDVVASTALVRDLWHHYNGRCKIAFQTNIPAIYEGNPYLTQLDGRDDPLHVTLDYQQGIKSSIRGNKHHFITWFHRDFEEKTGVKVPALQSKPDLHLTEEERLTPPVKGRYWLMVAGGKDDITIKHWDWSWYQQVVDHLRPRGFRFVQTGAIKKGHFHAKLQGVLDLVGWGYIRELMWLVYHSQGVICPTTCAMHVAAAFDKPCVVIAGGREEPWWEAYDDEHGAFGPAASPVVTPHRFLHTVGQLDCCQSSGCWKQLVVPGGKGGVCHRHAVRPFGHQTLPECMDMIRPEHVVEAVLSYRDEDPAEPEPELAAWEVPWQPLPDAPESPDVDWHRTGYRRRAPAALKWSSPRLGGKVTLLVNLRGDDHSQHKRCVDSLLKTCPRLRTSLRVFAYDIGEDTAEYLSGLRLDHLDFCSNMSPDYPLERSLWDDRGGIYTDYLIWLESPAQIVHAGWLDRLAETILKQNGDVGLYGVKRRYVVSEEERLWLERQSWHQGRPLRDRRGNPSAHGDSVFYCDRWCWAGSYHALRKSGVPRIPEIVPGDLDRDIIRGEQIYQNGYRMKSFNAAGELVRTPRTVQHDLQDKANQTNPLHGQVQRP